MKMYKNGGKTTQQDQSIWGKVHGRLCAAKEKARAKFVEYTTGNDHKVNGAAVKALIAANVAGLADMARQASFSLSNSHYFAGAVGSTAAVIEGAAVVTAGVLAWYAVDNRRSSKLYKDLSAGLKNSRNKLSAGVKKVIDGHLNKNSTALNNIIQSRKARAQG